MSGRAVQGGTHTLSASFASADGSVAVPGNPSLSILRDAETVVGPIGEPALIRDAPGLYRWVWSIPADIEIGVYVAAWSGLIGGHDEPAVAYEAFEITDRPEPDSALVVQPDDIAESLGIPLPLSTAGRAALREAILAGQADVQGYLGRDSLKPIERTAVGLWPIGDRWDIDTMEEIGAILRVAAETDADGIETGSFSVTYLAGIDVDDPALAPVKRYLVAHIQNAPRVLDLWRTSTGVKGPLTSVSTSGQSASFAAASLGGGGSAGSGVPGALPNASSMDRWRLSGQWAYQAPTQFGRRYR